MGYQAARKLHKGVHYLFWLARYDGTIESLACQSRRPHKHPRAHTEAELKLISDVRRRNPRLGLLEFWDRLRRNGYTRPPGSLYRVMKRMGYIQKDKPKKKYIPKPMEQMQYPGQRVQIDVKFVPSNCIVSRGEKYYQYTAIDEYSRLRYLEAFEEHSTYSSAVFLKNAAAFFKKHGFNIECVQTDNGLEFTNRLMPQVPINLRFLKQRFLLWAIRQSSSAFYAAYMVRSSAAIVRIKASFCHCFTIQICESAPVISRSNSIPMRPSAIFLLRLPEM